MQDARDLGLVTVVMISHRLDLPPELSRLRARFAMTLPDDEQILPLVREAAVRWAKKNDVGKVKTDSDTLQKARVESAGVNPQRGAASGPGRDYRRRCHYLNRHSRGQPGQVSADGYGRLIEFRVAHREFCQRGRHGEFQGLARQTEVGVCRG